jgi:hypothetical protein
LAHKKKGEHASLATEKENARGKGEKVDDGVVRPDRETVLAARKEKKEMAKKKRLEERRDKAMHGARKAEARVGEEEEHAELLSAPRLRRKGIDKKNEELMPPEQRHVLALTQRHVITLTCARALGSRLMLLSNV